MSKASLKIPFAVRCNKLVHISEVESGTRPECLCPVCRNPLIARKGSRRVHHFAHATEQKCHPETLLHVLGKWIMRARVEDAIASGKPLEFQWQCSECGRYHQRYLTYHVTRVVEEQNLQKARPDLALLDASAKVIAFVEIVVSHSPDWNVKQYCAENGVELLEFVVANGSDLERLSRDAILEAACVSIPCPNPKCSRCGRRLQERRLYVGNVRCWKCSGLMRVAIVAADGDTMPPSEMTEQEVSLAITRGAQIERCASRWGEHQANRCANCGRFWADEYIDRCDYVMRQSPGLHVGWSCRFCTDGSYTSADAASPASNVIASDQSCTTRHAERAEVATAESAPPAIKADQLSLNLFDAAGTG